MSNEYTENTELEKEDALSEEEEKTQLRLYENDILGGLMAAADFKSNEDEIHPVEIRRNGAVVLTFRIRPLSENEYDAAKEHNSKKKKNKQLGIMITESTDNIRYRSELIYIATVQEDQEKIWRNKTAWEKFNVVTGPDLISRVLKAGEKAAVLELIDNISGYGTSLEDTAKN